MIRFILLILIYDPRTLEIQKVYEPIPGYATRADCEADADVRVRHDQFPPGTAVYMKCFGFTEATPPEIF